MKKKYNTSLFISQSCANNNKTIKALPKTNWSAKNLYWMRNNNIHSIPIAQINLLTNILSQKIQQEKLIISQTDTIPGFLGLTTHPETIEKIYQIKQRPPEKKILLLISSWQMIEDFISPDFLTSQWRFFLQTLWPQLVTVIFPLNSTIKNKHALTKKDSYPFVSSLGDTIAFRVPPCHWLRMLIAKINQPLLAPSANISGQDLPPNPLAMIHQFRSHIQTFHFTIKDFPGYTHKFGHKYLKSDSPENLTKKEKLTENSTTSSMAIFMEKKSWPQTQPSTIIDITSGRIQLIRHGALDLKKIQHIAKTCYIKVEIPDPL